jgi:hypothetical protein
VAILLNFNNAVKILQRAIKINKMCVNWRAGCYTSSDDSHSMERHYGSIRRSARKDKVQKVAAAIAKGSSALTSSLMHSSAPVLRPLFFEVRQIIRAYAHAPICVQNILAPVGSGQKNVSGTKEN